jgi:hypothetical protein
MREPAALGSPLLEPLRPCYSTIRIADGIAPETWKGDILDAGPGRLALLFPSQVSQYLGRSKRLHELSLAARRVFAQADEAVSFPLVASLLRSAS